MDVHVFCRIVFNSMDGWMIMVCDVFLTRSCNVLFRVVNLVLMIFFLPFGFLYVYLFLRRLRMC